MYVGMAKLSVAIGQSHSLKEKRMVVRRIKDRVRERASVVLSEVGEPETRDSWQRAELGVAVVSSDRQKAHEILDEVVRIAAVAAGAGDAQLIGVAKDVITWDAATAPFAEVDDRTGAGDKAAAAEGDADWIPDAWREEADT